MTLDDDLSCRVLIAVTEYRDMVHRIEERIGFGSASHRTHTGKYDEARAKREWLDTLLADVRAREGT